MRETLDFSAVLGRLLQRISRVGAEAGLQDDGLEENCVWGATEKRLGGIKSWWDAKVLAEVGGADERGGEEVVGELGVEFWDDSWLDIIGLRDYQF